VAAQLFGEFLLADTAALVGVGGGEFFPLVHGVTNAYHLWRFDPVTGLIFDHFGIEGAAISMLSIFAAGMCLLFYEFNNTFLVSLKLGVILAVSLLFLAGLDSVILGALSWLPLVIAATNFALQNSSKLSGLAAVGAAVLMMSLAANQMAPFFGILLGIYIWERARYVPGRFRAAITSLLILPPIVSALFIPGPPFERYQPFSHFVPDYKTIQGRFGLIGAEIQFPVIDFHAVRALIDHPFILTSLLFFIFAAWKSFTQLSDRDPGFTRNPFNWKFPLVISAITTFSFLWFGLASPDLAQMSPVAAINRMLPGLSLISLPPVLFITLLLTLVTAIFQALPERDREYYAIGLLVIILAQPKNAPIMWSNKSLKEVLIDDMPLQSDGIELRQRREFISRFQGLSREQQRALSSPGLYLIRKRGLNAWQNFIDDKNLVFQDLEELTPELSVFNKTAELDKILDRDVTTRARIGVTPQSGQDALLIKFKKPIDLVGLWLRNDTFTSDYPRALRISVAEDCPLEAVRDRTQFKNLTVVFEHLDWEGAVRLSPAGVPFFGPITEIKITFKPQESVRCLLAEQPRIEPRYDWSVTGVQILTLKEAN
jgi:hypothetical protein